MLVIMFQNNRLKNNSPPIFFLLRIVNPEPTTFAKSNILQKRLDSTALSGKFSQWKKFAMAISKWALLDCWISIVFPILIPTSKDICKPPQPEDSDKLIGVDLSHFLWELASIAAAASCWLVRAVMNSSIPCFFLPSIHFFGHENPGRIYTSLLE